MLRNITYPKLTDLKGQAARISLTQTFAVVSAIVILIATALVATIYRQMTLDWLIAQAEQNNVATAQLLANAIQANNEAALLDLAAVDPAQLPDHPAVGNLRTQVESITRDAALWKIKIFDRDGDIIFSTRTIEIGENEGKGKGVTTALQDQVFSKMVMRHGTNTEGATVDLDLVESYVPISPQQGEIAALGAFEIYTDVTELVADIDRKKWAISLAALCAFSVMYVILLLVVRRGDQLLRTQTTHISQLAEAAELAEARLIGAIESTSEGFCLYDRDLKLILCNKRLGMMFPKSAPTLTPGSSLEDSIRHAALRGEYGPIENVEGFVKKSVALLTPARSVTFEQQLGDGRWILVSQYRTPEGGYVGLRTDLTMLKRREQEIKASKEKLELQTKNLLELTEQLRQSQRIANAANVSKSRFLAHMSHELRTPLNAILGFSDVIRQQIFGAVQPVQYVDYASFIHKSGEHLLSVVNDLLDLSKIEAGKMEARPELLNSSDLAKSCMHLVAGMAADSRLSMSMTIAEDCPELFADPRIAKQIIVNLLSNAVKFTPAGGKIGLRIGNAPGGIKIAVSDTGIGMTDEEVERAFQDFGQIDSDLARAHTGTGLGLPLVKAFAEMHGGSVSLESKKGVGTIVSVYLPWEDRPKAVPLSLASNA